MTVKVLITVVEYSQIIEDFAAIVFESTNIDSGSVPNFVHVHDLILGSKSDDTIYGGSDDDPILDEDRADEL